MSSVACANCSYFVTRRNATGLGECRFQPPVPRRTYDGRHAEHELGVWPIVALDGWCGEFHDRTRATRGVATPTIDQTTQPATERDTRPHGGPRDVCQSGRAKDQRSAGQ